MRGNSPSFDRRTLRLKPLFGERVATASLATTTASSGTAVVTLPSATEIFLTRESAAPRHLVYRPWTTPELIKRWWSANRGEVTLVEPQDALNPLEQVAISLG